MMMSNDLRTFIVPTRLVYCTQQWGAPKHQMLYVSNIAWSLLLVCRSPIWEHAPGIDLLESQRAQICCHLPL